MVLSLKPVSSACNMRCAYCYYVEKFPDNPIGIQSRMSTDVLEVAIRKYADAMPPDSTLTFLWHGGEPLLMPPAFYEVAVRLQKKYAAGRKVANSLQSNGTLITPQWTRFFAREGWLIGISIDGPEAVNDTYRTWPDGTATSRTVLGGISLLNAAGVEWNAMATVNSANVCRPEEFYDFMKELGTRFIQFTPIAERRRSDGALAHSRQPGDFTPESISPAQWGDFLCRVFDRWRAGDIGKVFVQVFDATLAGYLSADPGTCIFSPRCGMNPVIEANGDIYSCDHFVFDPFHIGNINSDTFHTLISRMQRFGDAKRSELPEECVKCRFLRLCNGECPKNRFASENTETPRNHFCEGYRRFFSYTEPFMRRAADAILRSSR